MSQWTDRVRNNAVWSALEGLGPLLDQALSRENLDAEAAAGIARLKTIQAFTGKRLAGVPADLLTPAPLDQIATNISNITQQVTAFVSSGTPQHIVSANGYADNILAQLSQLNVPASSEEYQAVRDAAEGFRAVAEKAIASTGAIASQAKNDLDTLRARLAELSNEVTQERSRLTALASDHQAQFSTAQETRNKDELAAQKERQDRFSALTTEYTDRLTKEAERFAEQTARAEKEQSDQLASLKTEFIGSASDIRRQLLDKKAEVEKVVGVIGDLAVTSGYVKRAKSAGQAVIFWQALAIVAMTGVIAFAVYAFKFAASPNFSWPSFTGRAVVILACGVLAAYSAAEASKYQRIESAAQRLALELAAIGPFLATLPLEKQEQFKLQIGDRVFGRDEPSQERPSPATLAATLKDLEPLLADLVAKAIKAAK